MLRISALTNPNNAARSRDGQPLQDDDGHLAWRQHDGGHEDRFNMKHFLDWANRMLNYKKL